MKLEITNKNVNPLFNRTELTFEVYYDAETPSRAIVIREIAKALKADENVVIVDYIRQPFGRKSCYGRAKVYKSVEDMNVESKHLLERAAKSLGKGKGTEAKPAEEAKPKPAE